MCEKMVVNDKAYSVIKLLGKGKGGYSYLATDGRGQYVLKQIRAMCRLLYPVQLNIDYFPTNFVVQGGTLYYIDFECNGYMEQWDFEH